MRFVLAVVILSCVASLAHAQSVHTVTVGQFFMPPTVSALEGDTVQFLFTAGHHGVTQAEGISDPCSPLEDGFNSGIVGGFVGNDTNQPPVWSLKITNASTPIFFYCPATIPSFHCSNGMVGAINVEPDQYTSYSLAAKSVTGTPDQASTAILSGVGAVATAAPFTPTPSVLPTTIATSSSYIPSLTATSNSSALPSETSTTSSKSSSSNVAAIAGGVGGGVAICVIALLGHLLFRSKRNQNASVTEPYKSEDSEKFDLDSNPATPPGLGDFTAGNAYHGDPFMNAGPPSTLQRVTSPWPMNMDGSSAVPHARSTVYTSMSGPVSEPPFSGGFPGQEFGARPPAPQSYETHPPQMQSPPPIHGTPNLNVHEIAKEVASLLGPQLRVANPQSPPPEGKSGRALPNPHANTVNENELPISPAPPQYNQFD